MPYKALLAVAAMVAGVSGTIWLLSAENNGQFSALMPDNEPKPLPATRTRNTPLSPGGDSSRNATHGPSDNALGFMLASVADQYQQTIRYPDYSVPLSAAQADAYQGNRYHPVDLPLDGDGQFTVSLDKFRFTRGETIVVVAALSGRQTFGNRLSAALETASDQKPAASTVLKAAESAGYYEGTLSSDHEPGEYRLLVEAQVDGRPVRHASSLTIEPYLGDFEGLGTPYISGNDLVIPVEFSPESSGYYALSAQLYNGQQPLAQLQAETSMGGSSGTFELRAHGSVIANHTISGALQLRHLQIRQLPARPGDRTHYAFGPDEGYEFSPPDLDKLRDEPAVNPESEQRAALLQQLADKF